MNKIKSIQIVNLHNNGKLYEVGKGVLDFEEKETYIVTDIDDNSQEFNQSYHSEFTIYGEDIDKKSKLLDRFINCPVSVEMYSSKMPTPKQKKLFPEEEKPKFNFKKSLIESGVEEQIVSDWLKVRTKKKAANTETALKRIVTEINKSGKTANECIKKAVENSWKGFKAEWLTNDSTNNKAKNLNDEWN